jgi:membrane associated rhomboid family serine protease
MILLVPVAVLEELPLSDRPTTVMWIWLALVCAMFGLERLVIFDHTFALQLLPSQLFMGVTFVVASWSCYSDGVLFVPWQLWSHAMIQPSWWQLACDIAIMMVIGRSVERQIGSLAMAIAMLVLLPVSATLYLIFSVGGILIGSQGLCLCLLGLAVGRMPQAQVQWGIPYWVIVAVGYVPLFVLALPIMVVMYVVLVVSTAPTSAAFTTGLWAVACVVMGLLIGITGPRAMKPTKVAASR